MTKEEYQAKYGIAPTLSPAPVKMTRAEYEKNYNQKPSFLETVSKGEVSFPADIEATNPTGNILRTAGNIPSSAVKLANPVNPFNLDSGVNIGANISRIVSTGYDVYRNQGPIEGTKNILKGFADTYLKIGEKIYGGLDKAYNALLDNPTQALKDASTHIAKIGIEDPLFIPSLLYGGGKVSPGELDVISTISKPITTEAKLLGQDIKTLSNIALTPSEDAVNSNIQNLFQKSIKPTAKKTATQGERYQNQTIEALQTIKKNAESLNIEDASGELVSGRTPETISELSQALDQTKKTVFSQYDALAKEAGRGGAVIDTGPIANEVFKVSQNKALQITNPEVVKYAEKWSERLQTLGSLDTETTQAVIKNLNDNLSAFYKNPTYESASKVAIDAGIANNFRKALDTAIEGATGKEYQALKNQYSALKAIENDVTRAAMRVGRRNVKGLLDYTDVFTSGQMLSGILSLNPAMFTKGAIERGIKEYIKFLNDPNRAIKNIFDQLDIPPVSEFVPKSQTAKFLANPKAGLSVESVSNFPEQFNFQATQLAREMAKRNIGSASVNLENTVNKIKSEAVAAQGRTNTNKFDFQRYFDQKFKEIREGKPAKNPNPSQTIPFPKGHESEIKAILDEMEKAKPNSVLANPKIAETNLKNEALDYQRRISSSEDIPVSGVDLKPFFQQKLKEIKTETTTKLNSAIQNKIGKAKEVKTRIDTLASEISAKTGNTFVPADIKTIESISRKLKEPDVLGNIDNIRDIARNTIMLDNPKSYNEIISSIRSKYPDAQIQKLDTKMGYQGTKINLFVNGLGSEIQIASPGMIYGKLLKENSLKFLGQKRFSEIAKKSGVEAGLGHKYYEEYRVLSQDEQISQKGKALVDKSLDYYGRLR